MALLLRRILLRLRAAILERARGYIPKFRDVLLRISSAASNLATLCRQLDSVRDCSVFVALKRWCRPGRSFGRVSHALCRGPSRHPMRPQREIICRCAPSCRPLFGRKRLGTHDQLFLEQAKHILRQAKTVGFGLSQQLCLQLFREFDSYSHSRYLVAKYFSSHGAISRLLVKASSIHACA